MVRAVNSIEHVLRYLRKIPNSLSFEDDKRGGSVSSSGSVIDQDHDGGGGGGCSIVIGDGGGQIDSENEYLADMVAKTCDFMDATIYSVLETLQQKVDRIWCILIK